jgi:hypothetical protein
VDQSGKVYRAKQENSLCMSCPENTLHPPVKIRNRAASAGECSILRAGAVPRNTTVNPKTRFAAVSQVCEKGKNML